MARAKRTPTCHPDRAHVAHGLCKVCYSDWNYRRARSRPGYARKARNKQLKRCFGITIEQLERMFDQQNGKCAICERVMRSPSVDHCHKSTLIRGLLCRPCNGYLGVLETIPGTRERLDAYLDKCDRIKALAEPEAEAAA